MSGDVKPQVFLSHNSADAAAVEAIAEKLIAVGIHPWLDKWHLVPGESVQPALEGALGSCHTCLVFIGPTGIGPWQNEEMRAAISRRVNDKSSEFRVIPVLLPGAARGERSRLPAFLVETTWVEFRDSVEDVAALNRLTCGINRVIPGPPSQS